MLRIKLNSYRTRVARHSSSVYALLAAMVLDAVLVVSLLHMTLRSEHGADSQRVPVVEPAQRVTFVTVSAANEIRAAKNAVTRTADAAVEKDMLVRSAGAAVIGSRTAL